MRKWNKMLDWISRNSIASWLTAGIIGLILFGMLNPHVNLNAKFKGGADREQIASQTRQIARNLGLNLDSLAIIYRRSNDQVRTADAFSSTSYGRWTVRIGRPVKHVSVWSGIDESVFHEYSYLTLEYDHQGNLRHLRTAAGRANPTFVAHDSLLAAVYDVVEKVFNYNLNAFQLQSVRASGRWTENAPKGRMLEDSSNYDPSIEGTVFQWKRVAGDPDSTQIHQLQLNIVPRLRRAPNLASNLQFGMSVRSFQATIPSEHKGSGNKTTTPFYLRFLGYLAVGLLAILVLVAGFQQIFRGQVDWRRAGMVSFLAGTVYLLGRSIYLMDTYGDFLTGSAGVTVFIGQLIGAVFVGLFMSMAYIGWEALARKQNQPQLPLIDALWRRRFHLREMGNAILIGLGTGFALSGLMAVILYSTGHFFVLSDNVIHNNLLASKLPALAISFGQLVEGVVIGLVCVGVPYSLFNRLVPGRIVAFTAGAVLIGFILLELELMPGITGVYLTRFAFLTGFAAAFLYIFEKWGLVTLIVSVATLIGVFFIGGYLYTNNLMLMRPGWGPLSVMGFLFLFSLSASVYGNSVENLDSYVPEYEERWAHQMRVEKEIEIARDSQFRLMPVKIPRVEGLDIFGFFLPSFEVGGDYFDYIHCTDPDNGQEVVAFTIVDVSGKAMKAAMHAVFTSGLLLSRLHVDAPAKILREVAPTLYNRTDRMTFITCIIGRYYIQSGKLLLSNAGHCRPILKRKGSSDFIYTKDPRLPLGIREQVPYENETLKLEKGDFLLLYSDGLPEATNPNGRQFGYDNLLGMVNELDTEGNSAKQSAREIKHRIQKYSNYQLADDTTILCFKT